MGPKTTALVAVLIVGAFACSGGSAGDAGSGSDSSTSSGAVSSSASSGGGTSTTSSGGASGVGTAESCTIPDAGVFDGGDMNPENPCQVCDPSLTASAWTPNVVCNSCTRGGASGICDALGNCCLLHCESDCKYPDGGSVPDSHGCTYDSDCCGIPRNSATDQGC